MNRPSGYHAALFESVTAAMRGEKILNEHGLACKLIPVPRYISSDCGVCLRIPSESALLAEELLKNALQDVQVVPLKSGK